MSNTPESVDLFNERVRTDGGPYYVETGDLNDLFVEPWNAGSAALFIVLALWWLWQLRGRYRQYPFMTGCLPLLLAGGIGGTIYHATRSLQIWFLMDVIPIGLLAVAAAIYLWMRLMPRWWLALPVIAFFLLLQRLGFVVGDFPRQWRINFSYGMLAVIILIPMVVILIRTRFRDVGWVVTALASFGLAWIARIADPGRPEMFPMGTHWLWHTFGAVATAALTVYFYRLEGSRIQAPRSAPDVTANG